LGAFARAREVEVVERVPGSSSPDFWGIANVPSALEREVLTRDGLAKHRQRYGDAIRSYNAEERMARTWPIQFLVRRTAHHVMDHAWEMEDRDLALGGKP
jgi:hypothetical protein